MEPLKSSDPSVLGDWRIMGRLGEGGFGTVYLAEKGAQKAAIKVIKSEFVEEGDARARLATEAEVLSKLSNPYIGKILDSDVNAELPWIATEFINGPTLDNKVKYEGPLSEIEWFNLAANLFHAIVAANELGVIHKDIKPSNIILGETGNKLIDFGIAHVSGQTKTVVFGDREGSTPFSSPEHFTPRANPKMDVFSTASTLAFAAKGSGVWVGDNDLQLMRSINDDEPNLKGLSQNQISFLKPLFEKNPSERSSALTAKSSAHDYIDFLLGNRKQPKIVVNGNVKKNEGILGQSRFMKSLKFMNRKRSYYPLIGLVSVGLFALLNNIFGIYFWAIVFLLFPLWVIWLTQKTFRQGIGAKKWGRRNLFRTALAFVASVLVPILLLFISLYSAATLPIDVKLFVNQLLSQSSSNSTLQETDSLKVNTVVSIETRQFNDAANSSFYRKNYKDSLESATKSADLGNAEGMYLAGRAAKAIGDEDLALKWFTKASQNNFSLGSLNAGIILLERRETTLAIKQLDHAIRLGNQEASTELGIYYLSVGENEKAINLLQDSIDNGDVTAMVQYAYFLKESGKTSEAIKYFKAASDSGDAVGSLFVGYLYSSDSKKIDLAKKFYELSFTRGLTEGSWFLGELLIKSGDFIGAEKAYLRASSTYPAAAISLSSLYGEKLNEASKACTWAIRVKNIKGVEASELNEAKELESIYCKNTSQSPAPAVIPKKKDTTTSPTPKSSSVTTRDPSPILSSDSFKVSAPMAANVIMDSLFGRAFIDGLKYWRIPLTNSKTEKVPALTAIQFRMIGYENAGWMDVPYKLKTDSTFGTVYAEVDDMLFAVIFKNVKYCPEFRVAREASGKIVQIWEKGLPECSTDYNG